MITNVHYFWHFIYYICIACNAFSSASFITQWQYIKVMLQQNTNVNVMLFSSGITVDVPAWGQLGGSYCACWASCWYKIKQVLILSCSGMVQQTHSRCLQPWRCEYARDLWRTYTSTYTERGGLKLCWNGIGFFSAIHCGLHMIESKSCS